MTLSIKGEYVHCTACTHAGVLNNPGHGLILLTSWNIQLYFILSTLIFLSILGCLSSSFRIGKYIIPISPNHFCWLLRGSCLTTAFWSQKSTKTQILGKAKRSVSTNKKLTHICHFGLHFKPTNSCWTSGIPSINQISLPNKLSKNSLLFIWIQVFKQSKQRTQTPVTWTVKSWLVWNSRIQTNIMFDI